MRGSRAYPALATRVSGIIPAHAGLTDTMVYAELNTKGSSPRMRGSPAAHQLDDARRGIIPAHAGLTICTRASAACCWDHPRACGAHDYLMADERGRWGSSPRMRGSLLIAALQVADAGIIPAHAGLTNLITLQVPPSWDHPRACGAHCASVSQKTGGRGSSPRMRGSLCGLNRG